MSPYEYTTIAHIPGPHRCPDCGEPLYEVVSLGVVRCRQCGWEMEAELYATFAALRDEP